MYELRAWAAKTEMLDMGLWRLEKAWKSGIFTRKTLLFGNINKMETLVYIITSLLSQKKFLKIPSYRWYLQLNFGYFKSRLALLEPIGTHFSQWIVKIQMFLSNFHLFDFTGKRRLQPLRECFSQQFLGLRSRHFFAVKKNKQKMRWSVSFLI